MDLHWSTRADPHHVSWTSGGADNVGSSADCTEDGDSTEADPKLTCATTAANSFTRDIKIKVSDDGSGQGVYFD
jgi:hypothetical protein